jgi:putative glycosyltransferase (TIGR04372 family)
MNISLLIQRQILQIREGGRKVFFRKLRIASRLALSELINFPSYILALPFVLLIRLLRPWLLIRFGRLVSSRIGHFAANPEIYLCERENGINVPDKCHIDIFFLNCKPISNYQLEKMWKRVLRVWPAWLVRPLIKVNKLIPDSKAHEIVDNTQHDRDVNNLLDQTKPHIVFTKEEVRKGEDGLRKIGIPELAPFVCFLVRDNAYLNSPDLSYHNYRDCNIHNYMLAAEELIKKGYFVIRMGHKVKEGIKNLNPKYIDYATNGMRTDFMDIYLGATCTFCVTTGAGWDAIPVSLFRKPVVYTNLVPFGYLLTFSEKFLLMTKRHFHAGRELTISEIFSYNVGFCMRAEDYEKERVELIENTPNELKNVIIEMAERIERIWEPAAEDESLQNKFWKIFPVNAIDAYKGARLHGKILARFSAVYLRQNQTWIR